MQLSKSILQLTLATTMVVAVACGDDEGDNNNNNTNPVTNNNVPDVTDNNNETTTVNNNVDFARNFVIEDGDMFNLAEWFLDDQMGNETVDDLMLTDAEDEDAPDFTPAANSPCAVGGETPNDAFFTDTDFRGGVDPDDNWTTGWTSINEDVSTGTGTSILPASFVSTYCTGMTCTITAADAVGVRLTEDMTWGPDYEFILVGDPGPANLFVGDDSEAGAVTLTILPGTTVKASGRIALVITRFSKIMAEGTRASPITFTSNAASPAAGDWGGLIINGRAPANCGDQCAGEGESGNYGGTVADDNSGSLRWVRIYYAGNQIVETNQYNGVAFQGVGSGTEVDYLETFSAQDDGVEFFGGTVNAKHMLIRNSGDDSMDWTFGWQGKVQYVVIQQFAGNDRGIEADNNEDNNTITPVSSPVISNLTIVGSVGTGGDAITLRRGTAGNIWNACVTTPEANCLDLDNDATFTNAQGGDLVLRNVTLSCQP